MQSYKLAIIAALGGSVLVACGDDGGLTTEATSGVTTSGGTTGADTTPTSTTQTSPPTTGETEPTTGTDETTGGGPTTPGTTEEPGTTGGATTGGGTTGDETTGGGTTGGGTTGEGTTGEGTTGDTGGDTEGTTGDGTTGAVESCEDTILNQDESDVDCGGGCDPCQADQLCNSNEDCITQACLAGVCVMPACTQDSECAMLNDPCNTGVCNLDTFSCEAQPMMDGAVCDDDDLCTLTSACMAGACTAGEMVDCAGQDTQCGMGVCDPQDGMCKTEADPDKEGMACNDNNTCTVGETCMAGACGDPNNKGYVFFEDFSNPAPGWMLDTNWEMGVAKASPAGTGMTGTDPALDHTPTDDNKLAGQIIGGLVTNTTTPLGMYRCLTTPKVDTANLATAWVTFWRHLHSDYANTYAINRIEVWDGTKWVLLEQGYLSPVTNDLVWKEIKFDITAYKNKDLQVRICHNRVSSNAYNYGGWSVDDVTIAPVSCTPTPMP